MKDLIFKGTPGPWRWELNEGYKQVQLCGGKPMYDLKVMDFVRYGMSSAAPRFNTVSDVGALNIMERVDNMSRIVEGREHHASWFKDIDHPDARLIAKAPDLLQVLIKYKEQGVLDIQEIDLLLESILNQP